MYVPPHYAAGDASRLRALIERYPFALLVSGGAEGCWATSLPLVYETDDPAETRLIGHLARRNGHAQALETTRAALAVFSGPNAYISSRWYIAKPEVPTWNYVAVQARGELEIFRDEETTRFVLDRTTTVVERGKPAAWTLAEAPAGRVEALLPYIVAFRLTIRQLEGVTKLSQTMPQANRLNVIRGLLASGGEGELAIARLMAEREADRLE